MPVTPATVQVALTPAQVACLRSILARLPEDHVDVAVEPTEPPLIAPGA